MKRIILIGLLILFLAMPCGAADYHVLTTSDKDHQSVVAFHITVPDETNAVGVNLRIAVSQHITQISQVPWLEATNPAEYAAIQAGEVYEYIETVCYNANLTIPQKRAAIDARFQQLSTTIPNKIRSMFRFWGLDRDVE